MSQLIKEERSRDSELKREASESDGSDCETEDHKLKVESDSSDDGSEAESESSKLIFKIDNNCYSEFLLSRDKAIKWSTSNNERRLAVSDIRPTPGPTSYTTARAKDPVSTFLLFFPPDVINLIINATNSEGSKVFQKDWSNIDQDDLYCYFGVLLLAGVYRSHNEPIFSLWDESFGRPIFRAAMSFKKFSMISGALCFDDANTRSGRKLSDNLAPIRELWDNWIVMLSKLYNPNKNVTVSEQILGFSGQCPFRHSYQSNPSKYGIRILVACDSITSYAWSMQIQTEKSKEENVSLQMVLDLSSGLEGHNITCDKSLMSYELGQELLKKNITILGPLKMNKREIPSELLMDNIPVCGSQFAFTSDTTLVSYVVKKKKPVILMSTLHTEAEISDRTDRQPVMVLDFNATKGSVQTLIQSISTYTCKRKTSRWPVVLFYNILDISAYNAYVLWMEINPEYNLNKAYKRRLFLEELGNSLVKPKVQSRQCLPKSVEAISLVTNAKAVCGTSEEGVRKKRRRCYMCPSRLDKKSTLYCDNCNKCICKTHSMRICCSCT